MNHLTDEQLLEWLDGAAGPALQAHLESCAACRAEAHELQDGISRYAIALRRQAAQAGSVRLKGFAPGRRLQHRLRWVGTGVLAVLLAAQTVWMMRQRPGAQSVPRPIAAAVPASPLPATSMSDDELLQAVNNDVNDEVPEALAPVGAITVARNRMAVSANQQSETQEVK
jgi:hypothetical protein